MRAEDRTHRPRVVMKWAIFVVKSVMVDPQAPTPTDPAESAHRCATRSAGLLLLNGRLLSYHAKGQYNTHECVRS